MADHGSFLGGYLVSRRNAEAWTSRTRTRPRTPRSPWWSAVALGAQLGTVAALLVVGSFTTRVLGGAVIGFVVAAIAVEAWWQRRVAADTTAAASGTRRVDPPAGNELRVST